MGPDGTQRTDEVWGLKVSEVRYRRNLEIGVGMLETLLR
jgi:hypothetical protein